MTPNGCVCEVRYLFWLRTPGMVHTLCCRLAVLSQYFLQPVGILTLVPDCKYSNLCQSLFVENEIISDDLYSCVWFISLFSDVRKVPDEMNGLFE